MIIDKNGNLFESECEFLVNPVNCVGVMGAGLALQFAKTYPHMASKYNSISKQGLISPGMLWIYKDVSGKSILNFPTKNHWKNKSELDYIIKGLSKFVSTYKGKGISSIAFPPLGSGLGGLDILNVKAIMLEYLSDLPIYIELYNFDRK